MSICERIKSLCDVRGITIYRIEKDCNLGNGSIMKWENSSPKVENVVKVADYFDVSVDYLLGRKKPVQESTFPIQRPNTLPFTDDELNIIMENKEGTKYFEQIISKLDTQQKIYVLSWLIGYAQNQGINLQL